MFHWFIMIHQIAEACTEVWSSYQMDSKWYVFGSFLHEDPSSSPLELLGLCKLVLQHWARESEWRVAKRIDSHAADLRKGLKSTHGPMSLPAEWKYCRLASLAEEAGVLHFKLMLVNVEVCWGIFSKLSLLCWSLLKLEGYQYCQCPSATKLVGPRVLSKAKKLKLKPPEVGLRVPSRWADAGPSPTPPGKRNLSCWGFPPAKVRESPAKKLWYDIEIHIV